MRVSGYSFNPRVREGRDKSQAPAVRHICVSIHASARDATYPFADSHASLVFQSTRPRGTRPLRRAATRLSGCFNPRVREGRDPASLRLLPVAVFQSTRPRGTRHLANMMWDTLSVSIHASARDATRRHCAMRSCPCFNPRVCEGRDSSICPLP